MALFGLAGLALLHLAATSAAQESTPPAQPPAATNAATAAGTVAGPAKPKPHSTTKHASSGTHSASSGHSSSSGKKRSHGKTSSKSRKRGQQAIDSTRAREIQEALMREHYLNGTPTGKWDDATQAAMRRYQEDQGWQSKTVPDSRALIKLGLGPSNDHLLNPDSAMTSGPARNQAESKANSADPKPVPSSGAQASSPSNSGNSPQP